MLARLNHYFVLMRFNKPIGILLLLWPTLWALWIAAKGIPNGLVLSVFVCGVVLMRAGGCIMNDVADRQFDRHVSRTQHRPITAGKVSVKEALILFVGLVVAAFILVCLTNKLTILLSLIALLLAVLYPFMKRFTHWPQFVLGMAFTWGVPMAFAAQTKHVPNIAWLIFIAGLLWTLIYDTQYAMVDREEDIKIGIKSTAVLFGCYDCFIIALLQVTMLIFLVLVGMLQRLSVYYFVGLLVVAVLFAYQQWLLQKRDTKSYFKAFLNNNWVGLIIFLGICLSYR